MNMIVLVSFGLVETYKMRHRENVVWLELQGGRVE